ncbi:MAG TPA: Ig-like domain-containing protein, partial [Polyangia bacterium]
MRQPWRSHWVGLVVAVLLAAACDSDEPAAQDAAFDSGATVERDGAEVSLPADRSHDLGTEVGLTSDADTASAPDVDAAPIADVRSPPSDVGGGFDADTADVAPVDADAATTDLLASITSLSIFPKDATLEGGESRTFVLTATLADGTTRVVTALATWTSSNPAAASIAHDPLAPSVATGVTPGRTTITAALDGHKATHELEVRGLSLVNLAIRGFSPTLARTSGRLTAWGTFIGGNPERIVERDISPFVRWHSTVPEAFEVSNTPGFAGRVTAMINGLQAQITASLGDLRAEREAFTGSGHGFTFVALPGTATLPLGARMRFHMLWVFPTNLPGVVPASWTSSDPTVAAFDDQ